MREIAIVEYWNNVDGLSYNQCDIV